MQTPVTLLERLRDAPDPRAWERFVDLYAPLMLDWLRRAGVAPHDARDLVQDVFVTLLRVLPEFRYDESGGFRKWLRTVVLNRWRDALRRNATPAQATQAILNQLEGPEPDGFFDEMEYRRQVTGRTLQVICGDFEPKTWQAFEQFVLEGQPAADVADALDVTPNAVYLARSRVLRRLREELHGLIE
ncbi:sigma-70 family RNA polymerase sigma factor [bacterium]|nr:sigma-70 family RNA polymerase sigma factor [bacterium]